MSCDYRLINNPPIATPWLRVEEQNVKMQIALCFILISVAFLIVIRSLCVMSQIIYFHIEAIFLDLQTYLLPGKLLILTTVLYHLQIL